MIQRSIYKAHNMHIQAIVTRLSLFFLVLFAFPVIGSKLLAQAVSIEDTDTKVGNASVTHSFIGVEAGSLLVLSTTCQYGNGLNATVSSSPALTWTKRVDAGATGGAEIYTAVFAAGGDISVTSNWGSYYQASVCYVVVNQEDVLGGTSGTAGSQSQPSVSITTTRNNSLIFCATSDWEAIAGTITYRGTATQTYWARDAASASFYHYYYSAATAGAYTVGLTSPNMDFGASTAALEIRSKADHTPPSTFTVSTSSIGSTTIDLIWTTAIDDVGVTGYDVYVGGVLHGSTSSTNYSLTGLTESTEYSIYVKAKDAAGNSTNSIPITYTTSGTVWSLTGNGGTNPSTNFIGTTDEQGLAFRTNNSSRMYISADGNVGIGTTDVATGDFKLYVETGIRTRKIKVDQLATAWPDYIFHPRYKLPSLKEVEKFIQKYRHLPDVPSAVEVEKKGLDLGDNQAVLLRKIEELTLYLIEMDKKMEKLSEENAALKESLEAKRK